MAVRTALRPGRHDRLAWGVALGVLSLLLSAGCGKKSDTEAGKPPEQAITGDPNQEVASVSGDKITLGEINRVVGMWKSGQFPNVDPTTPEPVMQQKAVDELIKQRVLFKAAADAGLAPAEGEVQQAMAQMRGQFPDSMAFRQALQQQGMSESDLARGWTIDSAIRRYVQTNIQDTVQVTPEQAETYFHSHTEEFMRPEQVRARHILVRVGEGAPPEQVEQARTRAEGLLNQVRHGGDFARIATENSDDGSRQNGGDLDYFQRGQMVPPFDSAAFALAPGEVSGLVRSQFGFHIIRVEDKRPAGPMAYEEVQPRLMQYLYQRRITQRVESLVEELKAKAKIKRKI